MGRKGFTLIELLAVIAVLAIIALIAVPLVLNIIEKAKKGSFKSSVYGIMKASEYEYAKNMLSNNSFRELVFEYEDGVESANPNGYQLNYNGKKPASGTLIIRENGEIALALFDGVYCAEKTYDEQEVTISKGNAGECIVEVEKPSIELLGSNPFYVEVDSTNPGIYEDPGFIALNIDESPSDNVTVEIYKEDILVDEIDTSNLGSYKIIYTVTEDGKVEQVERIVTIRDTTPPVLTVPGSKTITTNEVSGYDLMEGVLVTDNSGEVIPITISGNLSIIPGSYTLIYRAEDSSENFIEVERIITVQDIEAPVITILGDNPVTINVGSVYSDDGATALDNVDGDLTSNIIITSNVNPNDPGTYQVTYSVTDSSNNTTMNVRTVNVIDNIPPTVTFGTNGNSTWSKTHSTTINVVDLHSGIDNSGLRYLITTSSSGITENDITTVFSNNATISMTTQTGEYYIWVLGKDIAGNIKIERSNVFRVDNTGPVVSSVISIVNNVGSSSFIITRNGDAVDNHSGLANNSYIYQISLNGSSWTDKCITNSSNCDVSGLEPETTYHYRICAVDKALNRSCVGSKTTKTLEPILTGILTDERDNEDYKIVKIGDHWWMAENLRYTGNGCLGKNWDNNNSFDACVSHTPSWSGTKTEVLYQWKAAMNDSTESGSQGLCPDGWYVPTDNDWKKLAGFVDSTYEIGDSVWDGINWLGNDVGTKLKSSVSWNGADIYEFNGLPAGYNSSVDVLNGVGTGGHWWSSTSDGSASYRYHLQSNNSGLHRFLFNHSHGFSVRCIKSTGILTDKRDNKEYEIVKIGNRWWMAENLRYTGNGCLSKPRMDYNKCWTHIPNWSGSENEVLYEWSAAMNGSTVEGSQGVCPDGWYVPTDNDWKILEGSVDSTYGVGHTEWDKSNTARGNDVGKKLKSSIHWNGTDEFGFNALPAGTRIMDLEATLYYVGSHGYWWTSRSGDSVSALSRNMSSIDKVISRWEGKGNGFSVRCIMEQ